MGALTSKQKRFCNEYLVDHNAKRAATAAGYSARRGEQESKIFIYAITDPISGLVRYIGKTKDPQNRFRKHKSQNNKTRVCQWIKGLKAKEISPVFEIIDECSSYQWEAMERHYIRFFRALGAHLLNTMPGGEGGPTMSGRKLTEEQRRKIGDSKRGRPRPDLTEKNIASLSIKVRQLDLRGNLIKIHDSITAAARAVGRSERRIQGMVDGRGIRGRAVLSVAGFKFEKHGG